MLRRLPVSISAFLLAAAAFSSPVHAYVTPGEFVDEFGGDSETQEETQTTQDSTTDSNTDTTSTSGGTADNGGTTDAGTTEGAGGGGGSAGSGDGGQNVPLPSFSESRTETAGTTTTSPNGGTDTQPRTSTPDELLRMLQSSPTRTAAPQQQVRTRQPAPQPQRRQRPPADGLAATGPAAWLLGTSGLIAGMLVVSGVRRKAKLAAEAYEVRSLR